MVIRVVIARIRWTSVRLVFVRMGLFVSIILVVIFARWGFSSGGSVCVWCECRRVLGFGLGVSVVGKVKLDRYVYF